MNRAFSLLLYTIGFLAVTAVGSSAQPVEVRIGACGEAEVRVGHVICVRDFHLLVAGREWKYVCGVSNCEKSPEKIEDGMRTVRVRSRVARPDVGEVGDLRTTAQWSDSQLRLDYEIRMTAELDVETIRLNVLLPCEGSAGVANWYIVRPTEVNTGVFPARLGEASDLGDWNFDWMGWVLPGDHGVRFRPSREGLSGMYLQDGRRWGAADFQTCFTLVGPGTVRAGDVFRCSMTIEPLSTKQIAAQAFKLGKSLLSVEAHLSAQPDSPRVAGQIDLRNLLAQPRTVDLHWQVADSVSHPLVRGREVVRLPPLQSVTRRLSIPAPLDRDCRLKVVGWDRVHKVRESVEKRLVLGQLGGPRCAISLNGDWDFMAVPDGDLVYPPAGPWQKRTVPSSFDATAAHRFWLRRQFAVPAAMSGKLIRIRFAAVNFDAKVYVNGKDVGGHFGGYTPFAVDVTDVARPGEANELCVAITSWAAACTKPIPPFQPKTLENPAGRLPERSLIAPVGAGFLLCGIWQEVSLEAVPPVHIEEVFVRTSVRRHELLANVTLINEDKEPRTVWIANSICDNGGLAKRLPPRSVALSPGETKEVKFVEPWPNPKLWTLDSPHLYLLRTELLDPTDSPSKTAPRQPSIVTRHSPLDTSATRFGFREIWTRGKQVVLNGTPLTLFATSGWSTSSWEEAARHIARMKRAGTRCMRLHTQPWQPCILDAADELGMLIVDEAAVYCYERAYAVEDERFWSNYAKHLRELATRDRNHPSLALYSLENEILLCGGKPEVWEPRLARLADTLRQVDSTRLVTCEADLDPGGKMDVIGLHYPHEYWSGYTLYPDKCWWMNRAIDYIGRKWQWKRDKPLYIGEFDGGFMVWYPQYQAFWLGDAAYEGQPMAGRGTPENSTARLELIAMEVAAYRQYGVAGLNPWFDPQEVDTFGPTAYAPLCVNLRERTHHFRPGEAISRTLSIHNDSFRSARLELRWEARLGTEVVASGQRVVSLGPCEVTVHRAQFAAPKVGNRSSLRFSVMLMNAGKVVSKREQGLTIFPKLPRSGVPGSVALFDPLGKTRQSLDRLGLHSTPVTDLAHLPSGMKVLVLGAGCGGDSFASQAQPLARFVAEGGSVVCLEQTKYPARWLPVPVELDSTHSSVKAFARAFQHPVLRQVQPEDLTFWRPDNLVCRNTLLKPTKGNATAIIDAGGIRSAVNDMNGLNWTPLLELPYGKGRYLLCQLCLVEKLRVEPMAGRLLVNLLDYAATALSPRFLATGLLADPDGALKRTLDGVGLDYGSLLGRLAETDLSGYGLILVSGSPAIWEELAQSLDRVKSFVRAGGVLWIHRLGPEQVALGKSLLDLDFSLAVSGADPLHKIAQDAILSGLSNHELYWRDTPIWDQYTPMRRIVEHAFVMSSPNPRVQLLTDPPGLVKVSLGKGFVLLDQLLWDTGGIGDSAGRNRLEGLRIVSNLLTNLGGRLNLAPFVAGNPTEFFQVDLRKQCNLGFAGEPQGGWMDHGSAAMSGFPTGTAVLTGTPFDIIPPATNGGKSVIVLYGTARPNFPREAQGIPVSRKAGRLYFLHTCGWGRPEGAEAASYLVHYADGSQQVIPVRIGTEIRDWYIDPAPLPFAEVAWTGPCADKSGQIGAYSMEWVNSYPDKVISTLDFVSAGGEPVMVLIAVTGKR